MRLVLSTAQHHTDSGGFFPRCPDPKTHPETFRFSLDDVAWSGDKTSSLSVFVPSFMSSSCVNLFAIRSFVYGFTVLSLPCFCSEVKAKPVDLMVQ